jgi:hypothetical protein
LAVDDPGVYQNLQRNEELGKVFGVEPIDLIQSMVDALLDQNSITENQQQKLALNFRMSQNICNLCKSK